MNPLLLLLLIPFANSPISYRQLTWADYKGKPQSSAIASTCSGIVIEKDTAYAIFEPDRSWTRTNDPAILRHEQIHFWITFLFARQIALRIKRGQATNEEGDGCLVFFDEWRKMEEQYDRETDHGRDTLAQKQWEEKIKL